MEQIKEHTLIDAPRCFVIYQYTKQAMNLSGDIAEVGVYKGGSAKLIAKLLEPSNKTLHLFDTFSGMPPVDPTIDTGHKEGDYNDTSLERVKTFLKDCRNILFYKGLFPASAKPTEHLTFSFVHIDADIYRSVKDSCHFFYPRMLRGGIMIFDDYGFLCCPGAKKAVDEFFADKQEIPCYLPTGQCIVTRL